MEAKPNLQQRILRQHIVLGTLLSRAKEVAGQPVDSFRSPVKLNTDPALDDKTYIDNVTRVGLLKKNLVQKAIPNFQAQFDRLGSYISLAERLEEARLSLQKLRDLRAEGILSDDAPLQRAEGYVGRLETEKTEVEKAYEYLIPKPKIKEEPQKNNQENGTEGDLERRKPVQLTLNTQTGQATRKNEGEDEVLLVDRVVFAALQEFTRNQGREYPTEELRTILQEKTGLRNFSIADVVDKLRRFIGDDPKDPSHLTSQGQTRATRYVLQGIDVDTIKAVGPSRQAQINEFYSQPIPEKSLNALQTMVERPATLPEVLEILGTAKNGRLLHRGQAMRAIDRAIERLYVRVRRAQQNNLPITDNELQTWQKLEELTQKSSLRDVLNSAKWYMDGWFHGSDDPVVPLPEQSRPDEIIPTRSPEINFSPHEGAILGVIGLAQIGQPIEVAPDKEIMIALPGEVSEALVQLAKQMPRNITPQTYAQVRKPILDKLFALRNDPNCEDIIGRQNPELQKVLLELVTLDPLTYAALEKKLRTVTPDSARAEFGRSQHLVAVREQEDQKVSAKPNGLEHDMPTIRDELQVLIARWPGNFPDTIDIAAFQTAFNIKSQHKNIALEKFERFISDDPKKIKNLAHFDITGGQAIALLYFLRTKPGKTYNWQTRDLESLVRISQEEVNKYREAERIKREQSASSSGK